MGPAAAVADKSSPAEKKPTRTDPGQPRGAGREGHRNACASLRPALAPGNPDGLEIIAVCPPARRVHGPEVAHGSDTPRSEAVLPEDVVAVSVALRWNCVSAAWHQQCWPGLAERGALNPPGGTDASRCAPNPSGATPAIATQLGGCRDGAVRTPPGSRRRSPSRAAQSFSDQDCLWPARDVSDTGGSTPRRTFAVVVGDAAR
jgi:hypothetical protein